ncbi:lifeguard-like protein [Dinothrombium tinctorium]|uniref:Lifeguard-like protein n=2 Tax=Dinothrombium tinctorium TaxID=1965070 RepID=A0A443RAW6_9ACAR|nr:lifeguard-like protein [Dinothrombium tinctorium]RWS14849.1 lifeguard-like protein [Dinothrombium tinctorium]
MYSGYGYGDPESGGNFQNTFSAFEEKSIRLGFIRKVYGILSVQLFISFAFVLIPTVNEHVALFARNNPWLLILSLVIAFGSMITLACCEVHRSFPTNFICLGLFTLAESFMLMAVGATTKPEIVLWAVIITAVVCIALTIFAFQTKIDFTVFNGIMFVLLIVLMVMGIIMMFIEWSRVLHLVYAGLGAFIFSAYLVIDTQMIIGGSHKYQFSPEDYVFAAITLYVDIINLFLMILTILQASRD